MAKKTKLSVVPKQSRRKKADPYTIRLDGNNILFENIGNRSEKITVGIAAAREAGSLAGYAGLEFTPATLEGVEGSAGAKLMFSSVAEADAAFEALFLTVIDERTEEATKGARWVDPAMNAMVNGD